LHAVMINAICISNYYKNIVTAAIIQLF